MSKIILTRILALCGMLAPPMMAIIIVIAGSQTPGYNLFTDTISSLCRQGSQNPELMISGFLLFGFLTTGFAYGAHLGLEEQGIKSRNIWLALTLFGVGMICAGIFRAFPAGVVGPHNLEGTMHDISVTVAFCSLLIGMLLFAKKARYKRSWLVFTWFTIAATVISVVLSIIFIARSHIPYPGLFECIFYLVPTIWIEIISLWLFRISFTINKPQPAIIRMNYLNRVGKIILGFLFSAFFVRR